MKLIIDIPEKLAKKQWYTDKEIQTVIGKVWNVTPIPDNATNGEVIKVMFPNTEIMITDERVFLRDGTIVMVYPLIWWNSPYQKGVKE